jgi:2-oxoglutarate ferredoxin oxidoreductase subunit beta
MAIAAGATYVARGFAGEPAQLAELIKGGITHRGFAIIDVLSPCVSFNTLNTYDWFRKRVYKIGPEHDPSDRSAALLKALECEKTNWERLPIGLFYQESRPTYSELDIVLKKGPLVRQPMPTRDELQAVAEEYR